MNKRDIQPWVHWSGTWSAELGMFLYRCLAESSKWFTEVDYYYRGHTDKFVITTDKFNEHKDEIVRITELFSPISKPMLIEPRDWSNLHDGGYYFKPVN